MALYWNQRLFEAIAAKNEHLVYRGRIYWRAIVLFCINFMAACLFGRHRMGILFSGLCSRQGARVQTRGLKSAIWTPDKHKVAWDLWTTLHRYISTTFNLFDAPVPAVLSFLSDGQRIHTPAQRCSAHMPLAFTHNSVSYWLISLALVIINYSLPLDCWPSMLPIETV